MSLIGTDGRSFGGIQSSVVASSDGNVRPDGTIRKTRSRGRLSRPSPIILSRPKRHHRLFKRLSRAFFSISGRDANGSIDAKNAINALRHSRLTPIARWDCRCREFDVCADALLNKTQKRVMSTSPITPRFLLAVLRQRRDPGNAVGRAPACSRASRNTRFIIYLLATAGLGDRFRQREREREMS